MNFKYREKSEYSLLFGELPENATKDIYKESEAKYYDKLESLLSGREKIPVKKLDKIKIEK